MPKANKSKSKPMVFAENFEKCEGCDHVGADCIPYIVSLSSAELLEWCRIRKKQLRMTNEELAEKSNTALGTINRLFASKNTDFMYSSMQSVVFALLGLDTSEVSCHRPGYDERIQALEAQHEKELAQARQEDKRMIDVLKEQLEYEQKVAEGKSRAIKLLTVALVVVLSLIIIALLIDRLNPDIGFFWLKDLFSTTESVIPGRL